MSQPHSADPADMSFLEHLGELRKRLFVSALAVTIGAFIGFYFSDEVFKLFTAPYFHSFPGQMLIGTSPAEAFVLRIKVSVFSGLVLASPIVFHQIWLFISPGLLDEERKYVFPFVGSTTLLFAGGMWFCMQSVFPVTLSFFFKEYGSLGVTPTIRITDYMSFVIELLLGFGLVFEMPVLAFFLGRLGIIDHKFLIRSTRYAIVIIFILAAVLTPPDVLSQFLMAGPLLVLYGLSIVIVKLTEKKSATAGKQVGEKMPLS